MTIAICILTKSGLAHAEYWKNWVVGNEHLVNFYVHSKDGTRQLDLGSSSVTYIPTQPTEWGDISLVYAEVALYKKALKNKHNTFFILVSGECVPARSLDYMYGTLFDPQRPRRARILISKASKSDIPDQYVQLRNTQRLKTIARAPQWKILNRTVADYLVVTININNQFCRDIAATFIPSEINNKDLLAPDEVLIPTWLFSTKNGNFFESQNENAWCTYTDFEKDSPHPIVWDRIDRQLQQRIIHHDCFFIRKVSASALLDLPVENVDNPIAKGPIPRYTFNRKVLDSTIAAWVLQNGYSSKQASIHEILYRTNEIGKGSLQKCTPRSLIRLISLLDRGLHPVVAEYVLLSLENTARYEEMVRILATAPPTIPERQEGKSRTTEQLESDSTSWACVRVVFPKTNQTDGV